MKPFAAFLTIVLLSFTNLVNAQSPGSSRGYAAYGVPRGHYGFGAPVAGGVRHSSTAYEGAARGMAARVQAQGQYNLLTSLAAMNAAQAQRMYQENKRLKAEAYVAQQETYKQRRAAYWAERRGNRQRSASADQGQLTGLAWNR